MGACSAFLKRKNIVLSAKRYGVDALGAMAQGLFCSLLIGTILDTLGKQLGICLLYTSPRPAGQGRPMGRPGGHNGGGFRGKPAPAEPASFEDRLKQFMAASDSKLSELRQSERRSSRRGGRK